MYACTQQNKPSLTFFQSSIFIRQNCKGNTDEEKEKSCRTPTAYDSSVNDTMDFLCHDVRAGTKEICNPLVLYVNTRLSTTVQHYKSIRILLI